MELYFAHINADEDVSIVYRRHHGPRVSDRGAHR